MLSTSHVNRMLKLHVCCRLGCGSYCLSDREYHGLTALWSRTRLMLLTTWPRKQDASFLPVGCSTGSAGFFLAYDASNHVRVLIGWDGFTAFLRGFRAQWVSALTMTNYLSSSALFSTLDSILSKSNLSRLECAETQCARKPRKYLRVCNTGYLSTFTLIQINPCADVDRHPCVLCLCNVVENCTTGSRTISSVWLCLTHQASSWEDLRNRMQFSVWIINK